jgi:hypothetical protein
MFSDPFACATTNYFESGRASESLKDGSVPINLVEIDVHGIYAMKYALGASDN